MDAVSRAAVAEYIAEDERHEHAAIILSSLTAIQEIIGTAMTDLAKVDPQNPSPTFALWLAETLGPSRAVRGEPACELLRLLRTAQDAAARQAIAHGATWQQLADVLAEDRNNLWARYNR